MRDNEQFQLVSSKHSLEECATWKKNINNTYIYSKSWIHDIIIERNVGIVGSKKIIIRMMVDSNLLISWNKYKNNNIFHGYGMHYAVILFAYYYT